MVIVAEEENEGQEQNKVLAELPVLTGRQNGEALPDEYVATITHCTLHYVVIYMHYVIIMFFSLVKIFFFQIKIKFVALYF